jgi:class 3 adenylate cyclase
MNSQLDASDILSTIRVPCLVLHRVGDLVVNIEDGRFLAKHIPGARLVELSGEDHLPFIGENADDIVGQVTEFLTGVRAEVEIDRVLATVLLTDIVGSTIKAESLGDRGWRDLLDAHNGAVRKELNRFRGHEVKSLGDGFLATFDGPARAIRCACAIAQAVKPLGIDVRAGLHTGEVEYSDDDVRGIAVHLAARVSALASPGEVLVSRTVRDLVAGSGLRFLERGNHVLKGIQEPMQLFAAAS